MQVNVKWMGKMGFAGESAKSQNTVMMDASAEHHGEGSGVSPMEAVLIGLAGCTGMDVVSILRKKRVEFDQFNISVESQRSDSHPQVFTDIRLIFHFSGDNLREQVLKDTISLSIDKYCSVAAMLRKTATIHWELEIV